MSDIQPLLLIILDGFGYSTESYGNAIAQAKTPHLDEWFKTYPHYFLEASGSAVGLLPHQPGNSEVGHLTIGSGRIIPQDIVLIKKCIDTNALFTDKRILSLLERLALSKKTLHCMGLLSDGGVHSYEPLIYALLTMADKHCVKTISIHAFLDGRDTPPQSAHTYLQKLESSMPKNCTLSTLHGRFYAMDRDHNWERIHQSYSAMTQKQEVSFYTWKDALTYYYDQGITDEFIPPLQLHDSVLIERGDAVFHWNIRPDRMRELITILTDKNFDEFEAPALDLAWCLTGCSDTKESTTIPVVPQQKIDNTLKDVLAHHQKKIFSIAETEKYAHVTYFFNGMRENPLPGETRILVPSLPSRNYIDNPCMSAPTITKLVLRALQENKHDVYIINYANADMVGHSGNLNATIKAVECLDHHIKQLYDYAVRKLGGTIIIVGDHGKAEQLLDSVSGQRKTAHTTNPVPLLMLGGSELKSTQPLSSLADIAPYILSYMGIPIPPEMNKYSCS